MMKTAATQFLVMVVDGVTCRLISDASSASSFCLLSGETRGTDSWLAQSGLIVDRLPVNPPSRRSLFLPRTRTGATGSISESSDRGLLSSM